MPRFLLAAVAASMVLPCLAVAQDTVWTRRYNGSGRDDYACGLAMDPCGNVYVAGTCGYSPTFIGVVAYEAVSGDQLWARTISNRDYASDIALGPSGDVYVTGASGTQLQQNYFVACYDPTGTRRWLSYYNGPVSSGDSATGIAVDADGNCYVAGRSIGLDTSYDYATVKFNVDGETCWVARYAGPGASRDEAWAIVLDACGRPCVTGYSYAGANYDCVTIAYDPETGDSVWMSVYDGDSSAVGYAADADDWGNVYVAGWTGASYYVYDYLTIAFDSAGN